MISIDGSPPVSLTAFLLVNADDPDLCRMISEAAPGEKILAGGGAAGEVLIEILSPADPVVSLEVA